MSSVLGTVANVHRIVNANLFEAKVVFGFEESKPLFRRRASVSRGSRRHLRVMVDFSELKSEASIYTVGSKRCSGRVHFYLYCVVTVPGMGAGV
jgi:hypothetical protein